MNADQRMIREMCVLGWLIIDPKYVPQAYEKLRALDYQFSCRNHQQIFDAIVEAYHKDPAAVDAVKVRDEIVEQGGLGDGSNVTEMLAQILEAPPDGFVAERCLAGLSEAN